MSNHCYQRFLLLLLAFLLNNTLHAQQGVSINTSGAAPNSSSMLDVSSTSKGVLIPRMTNAQVATINSPASGLMIYQTDIDSGFYYYTGARWIQLAAVDTSTKSAWLLGGNANTNPLTHFIGTTDLKPLLFRVNNINAGGLYYTTGNTSLGENSLGYNKGSQNTAMGVAALRFNISGYSNTAIGYSSLRNNTLGTYNAAVGNNALKQ